MTDLFEEVEEQLRSDRYKQLARKLLPWVLGIAAAVLVGFLAYWGWTEYRNRQIAEASETYSAAMEAYVAGDRQKSQQLWAEVSNSQAGGYKALALMHLGAIQLEQNKTAEAVKLFDQAAEASPDPIIGDAARLKSALALLDTAPLSEMEGRLEPLMEQGRPFRALAREALAYAKVKAGDLAGARGEFVLINQSLDAPQSMQQRAQAAIGLIDSGSAKAIAQVAKSAQALPPMTVEPGAVVGAPQPQDGAPQ